jgi:hypothetical protein
MRITKGKAFVVTVMSLVFVTLLFIFTIPTEARPNLIENIASGILTALVAVATVYIGGNVADNGVKGKFYKDELNNKGGQ